MTKIVSTTISGNSEKAIYDALRSVAPMVNKCIVIDTGITDHTLSVAREAVGNKLLVREFPWCDDFAAARNFALQAAADAKADWAVTVDTDERLIPAEHFCMANAVVDDDLKIVHTHAQDKSYFKERILKVGAGLQWIGATHEYIAGAYTHEQRITLNLTFTELPRSWEKMQHKCKRDLRLLRKMVEDEPYNPRWVFYYALTHQNMGLHEEAIPLYLKVIKLTDWGREGETAAELIQHSYARTRRWDEGIALYERALVTRPELIQFEPFISSLRVLKAAYEARQAEHGDALPPTP